MPTQASRICTLDADVKKIEPTKKTAAATVGARDCTWLRGTPAAKQADPTTKSQPIQAIGRNDRSDTVSAELVDEIGDRVDDP